MNTNEIKLNIAMTSRNMLAHVTIVSYLIFFSFFVVAVVVIFYFLALSIYILTPAHHMSRSLFCTNISPSHCSAPPMHRCGPAVGSHEHCHMLFLLLRATLQMVRIWTHMLVRISLHDTVKIARTYYNLMTLRNGL